MKGTKQGEKEDIIASQGGMSRSNSASPPLSNDIQNSKNGSFEKLEVLILELKKSQEMEINLIKQELDAIKCFNTQPNLGMLSPWYNVQDSHNLPYNPVPPAQVPLLANPRPGLNQTNLNRLGQVGRLPPENVGGRPSYF